MTGKKFNPNNVLIFSIQSSYSKVISCVISDLVNVSLKSIVKIYTLFESVFIVTVTLNLLLH